MTAAPLALAAAVAFTLSTAAEVDAKPSCKTRAEQRGCKLTKSFGYQGRRNVAKGVPSTLLQGTVRQIRAGRRTRKRFVVLLSTTTRVKVTCTDGTSFQQLFDVTVTKRRPKVGKRYRVKTSTTRVGQEQDASGNVTLVTRTVAYRGTAKFGSAKRASVNLRFTQKLQRPTSTVVCTARLKRKLKRSF